MAQDALDSSRAAASEAEAPPPEPRTWSRRADAIALLLMLGYGLYLLWPIPLGRPPLSPDHPVHIARIDMWSEVLAGGDIRGWNDQWFMGAPIGDNYPILGDIGVLVLHWLGASVHAAYGWFVAFVYLFAGGTTYAIVRAMGGSPVAAALAGALYMVDPGAYREGGWKYTMWFGVWPQALSTSLQWLSVIVWWRILRQPVADARTVRNVVLAGLLTGLALLAHPMALVATAFLLIPTVGVWLRLPTTQRCTIPAGAAWIGSALALAGLLAAFWVGPLMQVSGYMASYGWYWRDLGWLLSHALRGQFAQGMSPLIGAGIVFGVLVSLVTRHPVRRSVALAGLMFWFLCSHESLTWLKLDRFSEGFRHLQWQRMIITAKPALFATAALAFTLFERPRWRATAWASRLWARVPGLPARLARALAGVRTRLADLRGRWPAWVSSVLAGVLALGFFVGAHASVASVHRAVKSGKPTMLRHPYRARADILPEQDYQDVLAYLREHADGRGVTFPHLHNDHWFMDATVFNPGLRVYKRGFTPADNFVHKLESGAARALDMADVGWSVEIVDATEPPADAEKVATFGMLEVYKRRTPKTQRAFRRTEHGRRIDRGVDVRTWTPSSGEIEVEVSEADPGDTLVFALPGYPRWKLSHDGSPVEWKEVPIYGNEPPIDPEERRAGKHRISNPGGVDGRYPILIATAAQPGVYRLEYEAWNTSDRIMSLLSAIAWLLIPILLLPRVGAWLARRVRTQRVLGFVVIAGCGLVALVLAQRFVSNTLKEREWAHCRVDETKGKIRMGLVKADMVPQRRLVVPADARGEHEVVFETPEPTEHIELWWAVDDSSGRAGHKGTHSVTLWANTDAGWQVIDTVELSRRIRHHTKIFALPEPAQEFSLVVNSDPDAARVGFDARIPTAEDLDEWKAGAAPSEDEAEASDDGAEASDDGAEASDDAVEPGASEAVRPSKQGPRNPTSLPKPRRPKPKTKPNTAPVAPQR